jgi:transposase
MLGSRENLRRQITIQVVDMESLIPEDYYLRSIDTAVDFSFIRAKVAHLYSHTSRPSIDPEIAFRIVTLSYLLGISENRLFTELPLHAGYLWFCGLDFNSSLPDHTTLVNARKLWRKLLIVNRIDPLCANKIDPLGNKIISCKSCAKRNEGVAPLPN